MSAKQNVKNVQVPASGDKHAIQIERDARRVRNMTVKRGTARAKRRAAGDFKPVNPEASLAQHPINTRYVRSLTATKVAKSVKSAEVVES